jgi:FHS family L-fucose permease-like MFS transporter
MAVGVIADRSSLGLSFMVPLAAYAFIAVFALAARRVPASPALAEPTTGASPIP